MATIEAWSADTFTALAEGTGAIYPMAGLEWLWLIIAVVFWLWWHFRTSSGETEEHDRLRSENPGRDAHLQQRSDWQIDRSDSLIRVVERAPYGASFRLCGGPESWIGIKKTKSPAARGGWPTYHSRLPNMGSTSPSPSSR